MTMTEIANNITLQYALVVIALLLAVLVYQQVSSKKHK